MHLEHWDGLQLVQSFPIQGGSNPFCFFVRLDGAGRLYVVSKWADQAGEFGTKIFRYDPADSGVMDASWDLGRTIVGYALGATGDSVYAVVNSNDFPFPRRLARLNLTTGVQSTVPLEPTWLDDTITDGDPTGFIYANVVDRNGDNDGDGIRNGVETAAGSNPFDPLSRPDGPKVYISFAQSNGAISLKYVDPDGLLDPTGGLNLASLSLVSSQQGEIFNYLLPFLTFVQLSPDQTEVTAFFGALPIPPDKKWQFEATVADKTGATGWDWQVTRPGDL
jgi:hypothetical protein